MEESQINSFFKCNTRSTSCCVNHSTNTGLARYKEVMIIDKLANLAKCIIFCRALLLRNGHEIIDNHPRAIYDASF